MAQAQFNPPPPVEKKNNTTRIVLIVVGVLVALSIACCVCFVVSTALVGGATEDVFDNVISTLDAESTLQAQ